MKNEDLIIEMLKQIQKRLDRLEDCQGEHGHKLIWLTDKVMDIWETRKEIVVHFGWKFALASFGISAGTTLG